MPRQSPRGVSQIPKPSREQLREAFTYCDETNSFWWKRNTAKRIRHRKAGYIRNTTKHSVHMINFGGINYAFVDLKAIYFSKETNDVPS